VVNVAFDPRIAYLGPFELGWHGIFTALAVLCAIWIGLRLAERRGLPAEALTEVVIWAVIAGLIGARLFHVLDHLPNYVAHPLNVLAIWEGGIAVYGAFLGGIAGGWLAARRMHLPAWVLLDAAAPAMLVGQAIGRLGCLSNGDAWGAPTGAAWGIVYWHPNDLLPADLLGVPTHPYPLYEIVAELDVLLGLWLGRRLSLPPGTRFLLVALAYGAIRFGLTFFRQETLILWGLQEAQLIALATGLVALGVLLWRNASRRASPLPAAG
jgi:phosphatidylglycerol:prolipoprotein diacylglycerol transferase